MQAFSLPGTSVGTKEAEEYLLARAEGTGRSAASAKLKRFGVGDRYPKQLDLMFFNVVAQATALFAAFRSSSFPPPPRETGLHITHCTHLINNAVIHSKFMYCGRKDQVPYPTLQQSRLGMTDINCGCDCFITVCREA